IRPQSAARPMTDTTRSTDVRDAARQSSRRMTRWIFAGLVAGILVGIFVHHHLDPATAAKTANAIRPFSTIFLNAIKMIIAPLIFSTLVAGIAGAGHIRDVGRIGIRALIYFEIVTTIALLVGLAVVNL